VASLGGTIAAERGVGMLKTGRLAGEWDARAIELHEQIKCAFDPKEPAQPRQEAR
jgi:FAD/FMN-containing dehydrogenase